MAVRFQRAAAMMVMAPIFGMAGCTTAPPPPAMPEAATEHSFITLSPPRPRPRRPDPCKLETVDLPTERKEALFKQFSSELATDPALQAAAAAPPLSPAGDCKPAAVH